MWEESEDSFLLRKGYKIFSNKKISLLMEDRKLKQCNNVYIRNLGSHCPVNNKKWCELKTHADFFKNTCRLGKTCFCIQLATRDLRHCRHNLVSMINRRKDGS